MGYRGIYCQEIAQQLFLKKIEDCQYFPKYLTIETCNNCNANCIMCPKGRQGIHELQIMDEGLYLKIVEELKSYSEWIEMVCLNSDGEPLIDKKIALRIKQLKEVGIKHVNISTNGALLSYQMINELIDAGLDDIRVSLDAYSPESYEKIRRGLKYETVMENVHKLIDIRNQRKSNMHIRIRMVELAENENERTEWLRYWRKQVNETDKVQIMPMHSWSGLMEEETKERIDFYSDKPCVSVFSSFTVNYDGTVQLCDSDVEQQVIMGNIRTESIKEIWQGGKFEEIRFCHANGMRNEIDICRGCDHWSRHFKEELTEKC